MENKEIECRFLDIDKDSLIKKLIKLGAKDEGEKFLSEIIMYDKDLAWKDNNKRMRLRTVDGETKLSYKEHFAHSVDGTTEIEFGVDDFKKAQDLLEKLGFVSFRHQEKWRHTLVLDGVSFDIDTWPRVPTYVELEGISEDALKKAAKAVGYEWSKAEFRNPRTVIENVYKIPLGTMRWFTFSKFE